MRKIILPWALCIMAFATAQQPATAQLLKKYVEGFGSRPFYYWQRGTCNPITNGIHPPYRTYDGTNNNLSSTSKKEWGAADIALYREVAPAYGSSDTKNAMNGTSRPSAREISNVICDEPETQFNSRNMSAFFYVWGQFIDHDMTLTPQDTIEYVPVTLPANEPLFTSPIPFFRSTKRAGTGVTNARQQSNINTAWLDASMIYGSDSTRARWLRKLQDGKMKISAGNMLPYNTTTGEYAAALDINSPSMGDDVNHTAKVYAAGDVRASEHPGILALHTIFVREHNRICTRLKTQGYTNDEQMYQIARKEVGALIQAITYQEWLPALGITLNTYTGYKSYVRPDICNTFATAGFRLGHTMVADDVALRDNNCDEVAPGDLDLADIFFNPSVITTYGLESFLKGFATHKQYETDNKVNSVLRNFLFGPGMGLDLASLNIQRGRDHGLPDYKSVRQFYTGTCITSFAQITSDTAKQSALQALYGNVNNIDLWIGILAEDQLPNKSAGITINAMLKYQFQNLRDGDYYYYKNDPYLPYSTRIAVSATKLSAVIKRNSTLTNLQSNVFFINPCPGEDGEDRFAQSETPELQSVSSIYSNVTVYPNPASDVLNITFTSDLQGNEHLTITDLSGRIIDSRMLNVNEGYNQIATDVSHLEKGIYSLRLKDSIFKVVIN